MNDAKHPAGAGVHRRAAGFTLIEVLVAMIVMAIGLLGVASLQIFSLRGSYEGLQRSQAAALANAVIDRMRSNPERLASYAGTRGGSTTTSEPAATCGDKETCLTVLAARDLYELEKLAEASDSLIDPRICISNNANTITVVVAWRGMEKRGDTSAALNDCGKNDIDNAYLKQIVMTTYIAPSNPY
ncbi:MAG TPA: type IV pilus modification protein PilV [Candidatus Competibacteraceae bacterium]|nr:type IV pilus modification protein PilV [Candidatus Competibacteraceae bacterium]